MRPALGFCALLACLVSGQARGAIELAGDIEVAAFPPSLVSGQFVSQTRIRLLYEGPGVVTAGMPGFLYDAAIHDPSLPVVAGDNTFGNAITTPYGGPGLPAVGTPVYSVLLHFDPNLGGLPFSLTQGIALSATIEFDQPILGVYVTSQALSATDSTFGVGGVTYPIDAARDLEFNYDGDAYSLSADRRTLSLTLYGHNGGRFDQLRILLASQPTPVPALQRLGLAILGATFAALGARLAAKAAIATC